MILLSIKVIDIMCMMVTFQHIIIASFLYKSQKNSTFKVLYWVILILISNSLSIKSLYIFEYKMYSSDWNTALLK